MARYIEQGIVRDGEGRIVAGALISVYLAGTTTPASIYIASSGGTAVNSVTSGTDGSFIFYVDDGDYSVTQKFKIVLSYSSRFDTQTWDNLKIGRQNEFAYVSGLTDFGLSVTSTESSSSGNVNLALIETTDPGWDRPLLRIIDNSTTGGAPNIRIDSPNPDIELVESDQTTPAGKFEIAGQGNRLQINSRNATDDSFETIMEFSQRSQTTDAVTINVDSSSLTRDVLTLRNYTNSSGARPGLSWRNEGDSMDSARLSSSIGASGQDSKFYIQVADSSKALQDRVVIDSSGHVGIGTTSPVETLHVLGDIVTSSTDATVGGGIRRTSATGIATLSGSSTTITLSIPNNAKLEGCQLRVNTTITSAAATSWAATYSGGNGRTITTGQVFTKNTQVNYLQAGYDITTNTTNIAITPNTGTFTGGVITAVCYYEALYALADAP